MSIPKVSHSNGFPDIFAKVLDDANENSFPMPEVREEAHNLNEEELLNKFQRFALVNPYRGTYPSGRSSSNTSIEDDAERTEEENSQDEEMPAIRRRLSFSAAEEFSIQASGGKEEGAAINKMQLGDELPVVYQLVASCMDQTDDKLALYDDQQKQELVLWVQFLESNKHRVGDENAEMYDQLYSQSIERLVNLGNFFPEPEGFIIPEEISDSQ